MSQFKKAQVKGPADEREGTVQHPSAITDTPAVDALIFDRRPEPTTAAALHDPRLAHKSSQPVRQQMVARYSQHLGNKATNLMLHRHREEERVAGSKRPVAGVIQNPKSKMGKWPVASGRWQVAGQKLKVES